MTSSDTRPDAVEDDDGFYDDCGRYWPSGAEWCDRCQGMGTEECLCAGDFCCCGYGERDCTRCGGEGYFVPTEAFKKARAETAKWWRELYEQLNQAPPPPISDDGEKG